jgi:hypothetical protein
VDRELGRAPHVGARRVHLVAAPVVGHQGVIEVGVGMQAGASRAIDLRTVDRHPLASVGTLVLGLRCSWCPESAPMPTLLGLYAFATGHDRKSQVILVDVPKMKVAGVDGNGTRDDRHHDPDCPEEENLKLARRRHVGPEPKCLFVQRLGTRKRLSLAVRSTYEPCNAGERQKAIN